MSAFYIILSVVFGLMLLGGIFYISHLIETAKQRQALLLSKTADRVQKFQRFLDCFEDGVLPKEIKLVLIEEILYNLRNMKRLNREDSRTNRLVEQAEEQHRDIMKSPDKPPNPPKVKDLAGAKEIQLQFKNLFRLLAYIGKTRKQHTKIINKNLKLLQSLFVETGVSVHRNIASSAAQQNKAKLALYHLNLAIGEYARVDSKKFAGQIKELRMQIANIEKQSKSEKPKETPKKEAQEQKKKDRGLDRMFDQQAEMSAKRNMR